MPSAKTLHATESEPETSSDEEFAPTEHVEQDTSASSDSENNAARVEKSSKKTRHRRKRPRADVELDSGDEVTIQARLKKRVKGKDERVIETSEDDFILSDDDGAVGLIKTRSQRRIESKQRRPLASMSNEKNNVDALWARMSASRREDVPPGSILADRADATDLAQSSAPANRAAASGDDMEYITIDRTYEFAGETRTEQRRVPKHSEEARVYLARQGAKQSSHVPDVPAEMDPSDGAQAGNLRRPLKRVSRFEANPSGYVRTLPEKLQLRWPRTTDEDGNLLAGVQASATGSAGNWFVRGAKAKPADKLNTVDKSRMDWAGFVDKEGIADDLDKYGKAKENFVERNQLLARLDERRGEQGRQARAGAKS